MNNDLIYLYGDLICSLVMMVAGCWLLTDHTLRRLNRSCHAFIATGALANVLGILADRLGYQDINYGYVWPGEVVVNIGLAVMMASWMWRSLRKRRERAVQASRVPNLR